MVSAFHTRGYGYYRPRGRSRAGYRTRSWLRW
jgi:hypothetical protein